MRVDCSIISAFCLSFLLQPLNLLHLMQPGSRKLYVPYHNSHHLRISEGFNQTLFRGRNIFMFKKYIYCLLACFAFLLRARCKLHFKLEVVEGYKHKAVTACDERKEFNLEVSDLRMARTLALQTIRDHLEMGFLQNSQSYRMNMKINYHRELPVSLSRSSAFTPLSSSTSPSSSIIASTSCSSAFFLSRLVSNL